MKCGKVWGSTEEIFIDNNCEVHLVNIDPNCQCSEHKHIHKWNMFYVLQGKLGIRVWKNDYDLVDETILEAGEKTSVGPGEYHQFFSLEEPVVALEIYYVDPIKPKDIIRRTVGSNSDPLNRKTETETKETSG